MNKETLGLVAGIAALLAACGGEVRTGGPDHPGTSEEPDSSSPSSSSGTGGDDPAGTVALPVCPKGFKAGQVIGKLCVYTTNGLCYETKLDACACACTKQSGTVCSSGFPEMNGTTKVTCY
jgi:hypothetical protein